MHTVYYTGEFKPVERCVRKLDGVVDVWLRRNPREDADGQKLADELYISFPEGDAPTLEALEADIDGWFEADATPEATLRDIVEALNALAELMLGGEKDG